MTMMNGFDARDVDILDEEFFGPPPRFLVEGRPDDYRVEGVKGGRRFRLAQPEPDQGTSRCMVAVHR